MNRNEQEVMTQMEVALLAVLDEFLHDMAFRL